jgi:hypothetical protein
LVEVSLAEVKAICSISHAGPYVAQFIRSRISAECCMARGFVSGEILSIATIIDNATVRSNRTLRIWDIELISESGATNLHLAIPAIPRK